MTEQNETPDIDDDTEGHFRFRGFQADVTPDSDDVEGHGRMRGTEADDAGDNDVEGHGRRI